MADDRRLRERARASLLRIERRLRAIVDDQDVRRIVADYERQDLAVKR